MINDILRFTTAGMDDGKVLYAGYYSIARIFL